jgi:hypothetical protein
VAVPELDGLSFAMRVVVGGDAGLFDSALRIYIDENWPRTSGQFGLFSNNGLNSTITNRKL